MSPAPRAPLDPPLHPPPTGAETPASPDTELRFGRCRVWPAQRRLWVDGAAVRLGSRAFDLLWTLIERRGRVVPKAELTALVWPGMVVEDNNLTVQMAALRKVLGADAIATVAGRGYQFVAPVEVAVAQGTANGVEGGKADRSEAGATDRATDRVDAGRDDRPAAGARTAAAPSAHGLPVERDAFVGRQLELAALAARREADAWLISVVGTGGAGKTRLVCRHAAGVAADWPGGVWFCDLSEARSRAGLASAVATSLAAPLGADDPIVQLGHGLAARGRCLVVLDNVEQILAEAAAALQCWRDLAVDARFLVTSRERLGLRGESVLLLEPLPPTREGVELFAVRARARLPDFALDADTRGDVERLVTLIDGLPLAVELAAARVQLLSPAQLLQRLQDRFRVLADPRAGPSRQGTLRSAIDWSWTLLTPWEQAALAQASVFAGPFTLEDAEAVIDLSPWPEAPAVMDVVQLLLDKSLLRVATPSRPDARVLERRFGLLVSIREYAAEKLQVDVDVDAAGDADAGAGAGAKGAGRPPSSAARAAQERHGRHFASRGRDAWLAALECDGGRARAQALAEDLENLVAACRSAVRRQDGTVAALSYAAAWWLLSSSGPFELGVSLGHGVLSLPTLTPRERAHTLRRLGQALRVAGQADAAEAQLRAALALHRQLDDDRGLAESQIALAGLMMLLQARYDESMALIDEALVVARRQGAGDLEGAALAHQAVVLNLKGQPEASLQRYHEALALLRAAGQVRRVAHTLVNLAALHDDLQRHADAQRCSEEALAMARDAGDRRTEGHALGALGLALLQQDRREAARPVLEAALAIATDTGNRRFESNMRRNLGDLLLRDGQAAAAVAQFERGLALARGAGHRLGEARLHGHLAEGLSALGRHEDARAAFAAGAEPLRAMQAWIEWGQLVCRQGCVELALGQHAAARRCADEVAARAGLEGPALMAALTPCLQPLRDAIDAAAAFSDAARPVRAAR